MRTESELKASDLRTMLAMVEPLAQSLMPEYRQPPHHQIAPFKTGIQRVKVVDVPFRVTLRHPNVDYDSSANMMRSARQEFIYSWGKPAEPGDPLPYARAPVGQTGSEWMIIPARTSSIVVLEFGEPGYGVYRFKPQNPKKRGRAKIEYFDDFVFEDAMGRYE